MRRWGGAGWALRGLVPGGSGAAGGGEPSAQAPLSALCCRNSLLEAELGQKGQRLPAARKTGTTIAGVVFKVRRAPGEALRGLAGGRAGAGAAPPPAGRGGRPSFLSRGRGRAARPRGGLVGKRRPGAAGGGGSAPAESFSASPASACGEPAPAAPVPGAAPRLAAPLGVGAGKVPFGDRGFGNNSLFL